MKLHFEYILSAVMRRRSGFSLVEITAALVILSLVCVSVLAVIDRCLTSTADLTLRMQAFEVARENMEKLLSQDSVKEKVDYGISDRYPGIEWETNVGTFYEPLTSEMWVRAVCSAQYTDSEGKQRTVELNHWLSSVSKSEMIEILKELDRRKKLLKKQTIKTIQRAAEYADVAVETIQQWIDNGMPRTGKGAFIKDMLDLYKNTNGYPTNKQLEQYRKDYDLLAGSLGKDITTDPTTPFAQAKSDTQAPSEGQEQTPKGPVKPIFDKFKNMSLLELLELLKSGSAD